MKKLIALILILALALPAAALAASKRDPIIGYWYIFLDVVQYPELKSSLENYDHGISMYYFDDSGIIYLLENDVKDCVSTPSYASTGKWEKTGSGYNVSILGIGETTLSLDGDAALLKLPSYPLSMKLRKIYTFNPYTDYIR